MSSDSSAAGRIIYRGRTLSAVGLIAVAGVVLLALLETPVEAHQGLAQKIFYVHAPSAWCTMLGFSLVGLSGGLYLWLNDPRLDRFAASSAEVGVVFASVILTTGPIWAKPIWGTWWTWDTRLTLTLFEFFLFVGYLALRASVHERSERARFSAVVGIMGLILVPFIHLSVYLWGGMHPRPILMKPSAPSLPPEMLRTLLISLGAFTLLYLGLVTLRYGIALAHDAVEETQNV